MSAIIHLMGRVTKDPVMQQGRNNGTEYISLDLATSQRSQNAQNNPENPYESVFYQCYLNKHLAERLLKAGVKKGTCLYIYGELELHPFVYSQGQRAGQAGSGAKINVRDWQFCLSNKSEGDAGGNQAGAPPYNGGAATPGAGGYPNPGPQNGGYQNPAGWYYVKKKYKLNVDFLQNQWILIPLFSAIMSSSSSNSASISSRNS